MPRQTLRAEGLTLSLGGRRVIAGVDLTLTAASWTAIIGPNGAGKSTLLALLSGLRTPDSGQVYLYGQPLTRTARTERARHIAWLAQEDVPTSDLSVREIVRLGRIPHSGLYGPASTHDDKIVDAAMAMTAISDFADERLSSLSGGEQQRVLLARALAVDAPILLLDEPTSHLDPPHQRALCRIIRERVGQGATVVTVVHDLSLALAADTLVVIDHGRVVASGQAGDPALHDALAVTFDQAVRMVQVSLNDCERWVAVPASGFER